MIAGRRVPASQSRGLYCMDAQEQIRRGVVWLGSATLVARLLDVGATVVVFGLLDKAEMGLGVLAISACAVAESLSGLGIGNALVQSPRVSRDEESSLFWLTSCIGVVLAAGLLIASPLLADTYDNAALSALVSMSALKLVLIGMSVVPLQLLGKQLRFREIGAVQTLASLGEGLTKIVLAASGAGAWSLIFGNIARGVVLLLALGLLSDFRPRLHFAFAETKRFMRVGLYVASSSVLFQVYKNVDYFLVGKLLGMEVLGLYRVAFDVAMQPTDAIIAVVNRVGLPVYSRLAGDVRALRSGFLSSTRSFLLLAAPVAAIIFFSAENVLEIVDPRWLDGRPAVEILVWASLLRAAALIFPQVYVAAGRPEYASLDSLVSLLALTTSFYCGLVFFPELGVLSVCLAWLGVYPLLLAGHLVVIQRFVSLRPLVYLKALAPGLGAITSMVLGLAALEWLWAFVSPPLASRRHLVLLELIAAVLVGLSIYVAYLRWVLRMRWSQLFAKRAAVATPEVPVEVARDAATEAAGEAAASTYPGPRLPPNVPVSK